MRDGWKKTTVGEVTKRVRRPAEVVANYEYPLLGVRWYGGGPFHRETVTHSTTKAKRFYRVRAGDFMYNKLFAWKGSFGVISPDLDGYFVSNEFPTFEMDSAEILAEYLFLIMSQESVWDQITRESTGSTATSRNRWKEERFAEWPILLPPLPTQRRIVDLISSIDQASTEAFARSNAAAQALEGLMETLLSENGPDEKLGDLVDMRSGPSWKAADESTEPVEGAVPVIKITNTRPNGELDLTERVFVEDLPESTRRLNLGSLLMIRTNGNRDRIGNVYRVTPEAVDHAYSAFQIGIFPKDAAFSDYLYWVIRSPAVQNAITDAASGTTGLGNIALSWLRELPVPWPDEEQRLRIVRVLDSVEEVQGNALNNAQKLKAARTAILSELLSGTRTMPDSYDRFLEEAS